MIDLQRNTFLLIFRIVVVLVQSTLIIQLEENKKQNKQLQWEVAWSDIMKMGGKLRRYRPPHASNLDQVLAFFIYTYINVTTGQVHNDAF